MPRGEQPAQASALLFDEADNARVPVTALGDIRPGSTIVLPSAYGGHDAYGWSGTRTTPTVDLGDFPPGVDSAPTRLDSHLLALLGDFGEDTTASIATALLGLPMEPRGAQQGGRRIGGGRARHGHGSRAERDSTVRAADRRSPADRRGRTARAGEAGRQDGPR
ncbi:hypothetical protein [Streptomyces palmae]|uniref:Uncharacterized protein n=1 Tax=Streptomyces palmae TaxID=1701085 RepID=A0A4Z0HJW8_9ACTN|nr:hypothetical protein [Streptomyces palmae]TGB19615.1 hypothetical protein E4099_00250 [Streptomyces palmae]